MATITVGETTNISTAGGPSAGTTYLILANPVSSNCTITSVTTKFLNHVTNVKIGLFYGSGSSWTMRSSTTLGSVASGVVTTTGLSLTANANDVIGIYGTFTPYTSSSGSGVKQYNGDAFTGGSKTYSDTGFFKTFTLYGTGSVVKWNSIQISKWDNSVVSKINQI